MRAALLGFLLVVTAVPAWLLATPAGLRWAADVAGTMTGGALTIGQTEGVLSGDFVVADVTYADPAATVHLDRVAVNLRLSRLLAGRVQAEILDVQTLAITVHDTPDAGEDPPDALTVRTPVRLAVERGTLRDFRLRIGDEAAEWVLPETAFAARWRDEWITISRLEARTLEAGPVRVKGRLAIRDDLLHFERHEIEGAFTGTVEGVLALSDSTENDLRAGWSELHAPPEWSENAAQFPRSTEGRLHLRGPWADYAWTLSAALGTPRLSGELVADGRADPRGLTFRRARLRTPRGEATAEGRLDWNAPVRVNGSVRFAAFDPALLFDGWPGRLDGEAGVQAEWRDGAIPHVAFDAVLRESELRGYPLALSARGRVDARGLELDRSTLRALGGSVDAEGRVTWAGTPRGAGRVAFESVDPGVLIAGWSGRLTGRGDFSGEWPRDAQVPSVDFRAELRDSMLRGYPVSLQARGRTRARRVELDEFRLRSGRTELTGRGRVLPDFALDAALRSPDLRAVWPELHGSAEASGRIGGTPESPRISVKGSANGLVYRAHRIDGVQLDASVSPDGHSDIALDLDGVESILHLTSASLTANGTRAEHSVSVKLQGRDAQAALRLDGAAHGAAWDGRLAVLEVSPPTGPAWVLEESAELSFADRQLSLDPACLRARDNRVCVQARVTPARQFVAFRVHRFDLAELRPWLGGEWDVRSEITGTAALAVADGEIADLRADLDAGAGHVATGKTRLEFGAGALRVREDGDARHATFRLQPAQGTVEGDIRLAAATRFLDRPMAGDVRVSLPDLSWLPLLSPEIASAAGALGARFDVGGIPRRPSLDGRVDVSGGRVRLTTPGIELKDFSALFESRPDEPLRIQVEAVSGGGPLRLEGRIDAVRPKLAGEFRLKGERAQFFDTPDIRAWASPDLKLVADGKAARLTGEIVVPRAEITPRELSPGGVSPSPDQVIVSEEAAAEPGGVARFTSDVRISLGDNVRFDGLGLKTRLTGGLTARDEPGRPTRARGELRLDGGRYKAYGQDLTIETGRLLFEGGPVTDPAIELRASRKPREDILVGLRARGRLEAPEFSLYSEPAMSQEEQLSWLVLGRSLDETLEGGQSAQLGAAAVGLGLVGGEVLAQRFGSELGLDEVTLGARPGETAEKARFTVGKYLSPKLFVSYGVGLFQPGQFFRLQYDLGKGFKLTGESGVQQGGDLLYSIER